MTPYLLMSTALVLAALAVATRANASSTDGAGSDGLPLGEPRSAAVVREGDRLRSLAVADSPSRPKTPKLTVRISETIVATWTCQTQLGQTHTKARSPWTPHSEAFRRWQLNVWTLRRGACLKALHAHDDMLRRLQRGLANTPMDGSAGPLEAAGRRYGISPYFIAGIAGTESSFGAAACRGNPYNAFGLSSCTTGWDVPYFRSWGEAYLFMAKFLTDRWPNAKSTYDYHGYAACSSCWGASTARHMRSRFGVGPEVALLVSEPTEGGSLLAVARLIRLEDHPTHPGGWDNLPRDVEFTPWREKELPPGTQSGTYFKSVRTTDDGREIWTWGRVDPETLAAGYVAGGGRRV